jgi:hypothetical protein
MREVDVPTSVLNTREVDIPTSVLNRREVDIPTSVLNRMEVDIPTSVLNRKEVDIPTSVLNMREVVYTTSVLKHMGSCIYNFRTKTYGKLYIEEKNPFVVGLLGPSQFHNNRDNLHPVSNMTHNTKMRKRQIQVFFSLLVRQCV